MFAVSCDDACADPGAAVQVETAGLGSSDLILASQLGNNRPDDSALLLQRVHIAEQDVELDPADPHMDIVTAKGSIAREMVNLSLGNGQV